MAKKKSKHPTSKKRKSAPTSEYPSWLVPLGIFVFAFLLYANTIGHGYVLDDDLVCNRNDFVQNGFSGLKDIFTHSWYYGFSDTPDRYYRPMMLAGFAVENSLFGNTPKVYHFFNVFYYALSCTFLFFVLKLLFGDKKFYVPLAVTLLFAAHPLHTEVVANIKSRDEIFAFLGLLGVIYGIIKYHRAQKSSYLVLALASYFFAILSKEAALAFLGVVPLVLYFFTKTSWEKIGVQTVYFGIIAAVYFGIRMSIIDPDPKPFEIFDNSLYAIDGRLNQLATATGMLGEYFKLLIFPHPLSFDYTYNTFPEVGWTNWKVLLSLATSIGLIFLTIRGLRSKSILSFAILFFAITFAITSNIFFLIGATFAERFMFVPLLGFCIIVSILLGKYLDVDKKKPPTAFLGVLGVILLLYSFQTITRNQVWESDETLFTTGIETAPNSCRTQSFYGVMHYRKAQKTQDPTLQKKYLETSVEYLKKSINTFPKFVETYQHLALTYEAQNQTQQAFETYQKAMDIDPTYFPAMTNYGVLSYKNGNYSQALNYLIRAVELAPKNGVILRALGLTYRAQNQLDLAAKYFKEALAVQYTEANLSSLVDVYRTMGDIETAIAFDKEIKRLRGELVE